MDRAVIEPVKMTLDKLIGGFGKLSHHDNVQCPIYIIL